MSRIAISLLLGSSLQLPWALAVEQLPLRGAEEVEIIKQVLATAQFSRLLQEPEGLTENRVESGRCSKAGSTMLGAGAPE